MYHCPGSNFHMPVAKPGASGHNRTWHAIASDPLGLVRVDASSVLQEYLSRSVAVLSILSTMHPAARRAAREKALFKAYARYNKGRYPCLGFAAASLLSAAAIVAAPLALAVVVAALAVQAMINAEGGKMTER
ncbi:hypothetical protein K438DRAFT_1785126 [Mycena galopus ATCC 62051]|nr:hypothetical protein K438DRAFT_1785126 [Mycena galopus ATCC 62051]